MNVKWFIQCVCMYVLSQDRRYSREPSVGRGLVDRLPGRRSSSSAGSIPDPGLPTTATRYHAACVQNTHPHTHYYIISVLWQWDFFGNDSSYSKRLGKTVDGGHVKILNVLFICLAATSSCNCIYIQQCVPGVPIHQPLLLNYYNKTLQNKLNRPIL